MILQNTLMIMITVGQQTNQYSSTDIAFSPNMVGGATINFIPLKMLS
jgi:hypothetical protein